VAVVSVIGRRVYAWLMNLTGVFGTVVLLFPKAYHDFATTLLYEHTNEVEWNDRFTNRIRPIGVIYILLAVWTYIKRRADD
jgi:chromate transport protein ChrA